MESSGLSALVLAGGGARRLGGADKPGLLVGGVPLLDRVLAAVADADPVVVVGPERRTLRPVRWAREQPPGAGPVAGLAAGLAVLPLGQVALLAADLPFLDEATVRLLAGAARGHDGALLVDETGREQWLCGVWSAERLRAALAPVEPAGAPLRAVLGGLDAVRVSAPRRPGAPAVWFDCDTEADLATARHGVTGDGAAPQGVTGHGAAPQGVTGDGA